MGDFTCALSTEFGHVATGRVAGAPVRSTAPVGPFAVVARAWDVYSTCHGLRVSDDTQHSTGKHTEH